MLRKHTNATSISRKQPSTHSLTNTMKRTRPQAQFDVNVLKLNREHVSGPLKKPTKYTFLFDEKNDVKTGCWMMRTCGGRPSRRRPSPPPPSAPPCTPAWPQPPPVPPPAPPAEAPAAPPALLKKWSLRRRMHARSNWISSRSNVSSWSFN